MESQSLGPDLKQDHNSRSKGRVTWSIRRVERDTRLVIEKAADYTGKTIGQYVNKDIRGFCQSQLTQTQLPAAPVDIQNQIDHLTRLVEGIASRIPEQGRRSFWQRLMKR